MKKLCKNCNKEFNARDISRQTCSVTCRDKLKLQIYLDRIPKNVIDLWKSGKSSIELSKHFNVHPSTICKWIKDISDIDTSINRFNGRESKFWGGYGGISKYFWSRIKYCAKYRNIQFNITIEDAWNQYIKQNGKCALSGVDLNLECDKHNKEFAQKGELFASLDRIDSSKGYIKNNIQWIHKDIQFMKRDWSDIKLIDWCSKIYQYNSQNLV